MRNDFDKLLSFHKESNFLKFSQFYFERDILRIAATMFMAEMELKKKGRLERITIPLFTKTYQETEIKKLKQVLSELFLLILLEKVQIDITEFDDSKQRVFKAQEIPPSEAVILFSGGLDSYAGIKLAERIYKQLLAVFVAHSDQGRIISIVNKQKAGIKSTIKTVYAPPMGSSGYSQLRGFLYILSGAVYVNLCKTNQIIVTECGPTMYQTLFSPFDSITYTTHPYVLKAVKECINILFRREVKIVIPFENLTKAEVVAASDIKDFSAAHSCISQRFGNHDGTCFGCVVKRMASTVNDVKDVRYTHDMFDGATNQDNLLQLLQFSEDVLTNYKNMPLFQKEKIEEFGKQDLFRRFALDNFAAVMFSVEKHHPLYKKYVQKREKILDKRVTQIWDKELKPNFKKVVN
jgi:7-cyano-7-deazaguanine synthase in queuosine biosynthesis